MAGPQPAPSKSQANKAGRRIRALIRGEPISDDEFELAFLTLLDFRACHQTPLGKATMGLRSVVQTERCAVEVSQRLKRVSTIIDKLGREPTMQLANMQDIGGCRAVLANMDELRRVEKRLKKNRPPRGSRDVSDYVIAPRDSGYRAVHVVVQYDSRSIEVQLRTQVMHSWAIAVERLGGRLQEDLKSGRGPQEVLEFLGAVSEAMAIEEQGGEVDASLIAEIDRLRRHAGPWLGGAT